MVGADGSGEVVDAVGSSALVVSVAVVPEQAASTIMVAKANPPDLRPLIDESYAMARAADLTHGIKQQTPRSPPRATDRYRFADLDVALSTHGPPVRDGSVT